MKVSEKQLLMLLDVLKGTLQVPNVVGGYTLQVRQQLTNDLINQQSNKPVEVDLHLKPNKSVKIPEYDNLSEGCDPEKYKDA